uniref:Uncharacterized protein n=1 Tax=Cacopsylla melanoneura TaxID=428564 RepID=A0A8D8WJS1_9HEMI
MASPIREIVARLTPRIYILLVEMSQNRCKQNTGVGTELLQTTNSPRFLTFLSLSFFFKVIFLQDFFNFNSLCSYFCDYTHRHTYIPIKKIAFKSMLIPQSLGLKMDG